MKTTVPYRVPTLPPLTWTAEHVRRTGLDREFAGGPPAGPDTVDGAEDASTVPSAAIATTAVTGWSLRTGPVIAGTISVPFGFVLASPGCTFRPKSPSTVPAGTPSG